MKVNEKDGFISGFSYIMRLSTMAGAAGFAVGGPAGALIGLGLAYGGEKAFDWVHDHADDIREGASDLWEGTKSFVGDAWSGMTDGLGTIFG